MRFRRLATVVAAVAFAIGPLAGGVAAGSSDPTQARPSDLDLQVSCSVSADQQTITAQVSFVWHRVDLTIPGTNTGPGYDVVGVYPQGTLVEVQRLDFPYPNPPLVNLSWQTPYPWSQDGPWDLSDRWQIRRGLRSSALVYDGRDMVPSCCCERREIPAGSGQFNARSGPNLLWQRLFTYHPDVYSLPG